MGRLADKRSGRLAYRQIGGMHAQRIFVTTFTLWNSAKDAKQSMLLQIHPKS